MKNPEISNLKKKVQWETSCFMRTDRQTDGRKDIQTDTINANSRVSHFF